VILPDLTSAEYRYNGDELRTWRREPSGAETNYDWIPSGILGLSQVLNETDGTGAPKANYVLGPNGLIALIDGDGHERYYVFDALGSVLALTDETGAVTDTYAYDEYGVFLHDNSSHGNSIGYVSLSRDSETSMMYVRSRSYLPSIGIFIRRDSLSHLLSTHLYGYAAANPIHYVDIDGNDVTVPSPVHGFGPDCASVSRRVIQIYRSYQQQKNAQWGPIEGANWLSGDKNAKPCADQAAELIDLLEDIPGINSCFVVRFGVFGYTMNWAGHVYVKLDPLKGNQGITLDPYFNSDPHFWTPFNDFSRPNYGPKY